MEQGSESPWSGTVLGVAALIALPFVLLAWLLVQTTLGHATRYEQMSKVLDAFRAGNAVIEPLETMRDLAPSRIYLGEEIVTSRFETAKAQADKNLRDFLSIARRINNAALLDNTDRVEQAWHDLDITDQSSNTVVPYENIERFNDEIYATMASMLFVSDMTAGRTVDANELLILLLDTLKRARHELGVIRAIAVYTTLRDGFLSSADAEYLDGAWSNLDTLHAALVAQQKSLNGRLGKEGALTTDFRPLRDYLVRSEETMVLAPRIDQAWQTAWEEGETAIAVLRQADNEIVNTAATLIRSEQRRQLFVDISAAIGLILLYLLITALGVLFYRTRYAVVHAQAESRAKGLFLARMSHEIRTPLNGVIGLAELLADTEPTPRQREYIELIGSAGKSLVSLVNDILDHAKIEAGKLEIERVSLDIRALVSESVQVFGLRAGQNHTLLFCQAEPDVPRYILGDPMRIRQILLNLIANAVKFTEQGRVEVCVEQAAANDGSRRLRIEVRDTGIGLTPAEQQGLFTRFTQASSEVTRRFGGTGLGLSISRELVQLMGGSIGVYSGVGPGSVFWFELPLTIAPGAPQTPHASEITSVLPAPVLLVDTDGHLARAVTALPSAVTERVSIAVSDLDAQRMLDMHHDIRFVVINGTRRVDDARVLAQQLKGFHPHVQIRLLVAVGTESGAMAGNTPSPGQHGETSVDEVVSRSVFTPNQLLQLLTPRNPADSRAPTTGTVPVRAILPTGLRVLVAEDNPVNQLVTRGLLRRLGIEADVVDDGRKAVERYIGQLGNYDIVLMDLDMPVMDGNAAARAIRRVEGSNAWGRCPILALSAHAMPEYGTQARAAGMDGQLVKPVTLANLSDALLRHCRREKPTAGHHPADDFSI